MNDTATPPAPLNFASRLLEVNRSRSHKAAFVDDHGVLSYGGLDRRVRSVAAGLRALGLRREERVEFVADLPKTATGKIQRFKWREPQAGRR